MTVPETWDDFTRQSYKSSLELASTKFRFCSYLDPLVGQTNLIWRHDVDFSLQGAAEIGAIDRSLGVKSTFFLRLRSETYNLLEHRNIELAQEILDMGHHVGLHLDVDFSNILTRNDLEQALQRDKRIIESILNTTVRTFSYHNPTVSILQFNADSYLGLINTYSKKLQETFSYASDSGGYWRFTSLHEVLKKSDNVNLQVLTHPEWWTTKPMPPYMRIHGAALNQYQAALDKYQSDLKRLDRLNHKGLSECLDLFDASFAIESQHLNFLWQTERFDLLFLASFMLLQRILAENSVSRFGKSHIRPDELIDLNRSLYEWLDSLSIEVKEKSLDLIVDHSGENYNRWISYFLSLIQGETEVTPWQLECASDQILRTIHFLQSRIH